MAAGCEEKSLLVRHLRPVAALVTYVQDPQALFRTIARQVPDLLFLDRRVPGMPTAQLIDRLHADPTIAHCPIVVASSVEYADLIPGTSSIREEGATAVLDLPYTRASIQRLIRRLNPTTTAAARTEKTAAFGSASAEP